MPKMLYTRSTITKMEHGELKPDEMKNVVNRLNINLDITNARLDLAIQAAHKMREEAKLKSD